MIGRSDPTGASEQSAAHQIHRAPTAPLLAAASTIAYKGTRRRGKQRGAHTYFFSSPWPFRLSLCGVAPLPVAANCSQSAAPGVALALCGYACVLRRQSCFRFVPPPPPPAFVLCYLFLVIAAGMGDKEEGKAAAEMAGPAAAWRLNASDFQMPERPKEPPFVTRVFLRGHSTLPCSVACFSSSVSL